MLRPPSSSIATTRVLLAAPGILLLGLFFLLPLGFIVLEAGQDGIGGLARLLSQKIFWAGLGNSLALGALAGFVSLVGGFAVALRLARMASRSRTIWLFAISLPLTFSGLIVAFGFILAFGRSGFVTRLLDSLAGVDPVAFSQAVYSPFGLAFVYSYYLIPRVVMMLVPVLVNFDERQIAAAQSLGASRIRALRDVLLPQVRGAMVSAFALVAAVAVGAYGTALALVGTQVNILPLQLFTLVSDAGADFAVTATLGLLLLALCSMIMAVGEWAGAGRRP